MLAERVTEWTEEWKRQGRQEGEARIIRRQLMDRFGPLPEWAERKLSEASPAMLELWAVRVLSAASFEDVFQSDEH